MNLKEELMVSVANNDKQRFIAACRKALGLRENKVVYTPHREEIEDLWICWKCQREGERLTEWGDFFRTPQHILRLLKELEIQPTQLMKDTSSWVELSTIGKTDKCIQYNCLIEGLYQYYLELLESS